MARRGCSPRRQRRSRRASRPRSRDRRGRHRQGRTWNAALLTRTNDYTGGTVIVGGDAGRGAGQSCQFRGAVSTACCGAAGCVGAVTAHGRDDRLDVTGTFALDRTRPWTPALIALGPRRDLVTSMGRSSARTTVAGDRRRLSWRARSYTVDPRRRVADAGDLHDLDNDRSDPVNGTFADLPEGARVDVGGVPVPDHVSRRRRQRRGAAPTSRRSSIRSPKARPGRSSTKTSSSPTRTPSMRPSP